MTCVEAIFDTLAGRATAGLDHECFNDLVMGCFALASGESSEPDVAAWIAAHDKERSELEVYLDICDYFKRFHGSERPSDILARAVEAGRAAL